MIKLLTALLLTFATQAGAMRTLSEVIYEKNLRECKKNPTSESCQSVCGGENLLKKEDKLRGDYEICQKYCSNPETLTLEGCKDFPIVERFKDTEAEKLINKGKIISTDTKGRRTILFLKYKSKIYSCTLSTQSNSTTMCERSISR